MPQIVFLPHPEHCPEGAVVEAQPGETILKAALRNGIDIEHACEMVAACATCHVHVRAGAESLPDPDDEESDQLDHAWGLDAQSRLACCVKPRDTDLTIELPRHSRNHARER